MKISIEIKNKQVAFKHLCESLAAVIVGSTMEAEMDSFKVSRDANEVLQELTGWPTITTEDQEELPSDEDDKNE